MVQAVNSLGPSQENPTSSITTAQTAPAAVVNLTVVAGSESSQGDSLTLTWAVSDWGESDKANAATPSGYPYCPVSWLVQTTCPGYRYFLVTPFRIGDDYRKPTFVYGNAFRYTLSGLSGGVDYTFVVTAVNTGGLESPKGDARMNSGTGVGVLKYRTVSVVPRQITSLNVYTPPNPDLGANYRIGIEWTIPIDTETTGGMTLAGFVLEYGLLAGCQDGCADSSTACIASRSGILWTVVANVGYVDRFEWTAGLKGMTYVFRISAVNGIGRGATWPSCATVSDINCAGVPNGQIPYTCHSAVFTVPSKAKDFGIWGDTAAGAQPIAGGGFEVRWGLGAGNAANEYFSYSDKTLNGGRNIEMVEIQRTKRTTLRWPLDYYCPTLPANQEGELPVCVYATGCVPVPCTAACPICVTSAYTQSALEIKKITDFIIGETLDFADIYLYRIRFSNVGINDCASRPVLTSGSSPNCDWSEWSELAQVQVAKPNRYHNLFTRVNSPTEVQILWFVPTGVLANGASPADFGDFVNIWFGPTVASVSVSPFDKGNFTKGPARGTSWQTFPVTKLVPATTYFFTVVSYYSTNNNEIQSTRSDVTRAVRTSVAIPASVANCSVTVPAVAADVMAGGLVVSWIQLAPTCTKGNGLFLADGSVHNCERGEGIPLASYKISYRKFEGGGWNSIRVSSSLDTYTVRGLEKETKYLFKVSAINSAHEGSASPEATGTPIATIPGSPPPPLSTGASVSSVRVAWQEPADLGTKQILETKFRLTIYPRRDGRPGNETITFTWEREYVVTGLIPNSLYLFSVAYQAKPMLGFGFKSETAFVFTTPLAPVNLRLNDGKSVTESTTVRIKWSWTGVIQGNVRRHVRASERLANIPSCSCIPLCPFIPASCPLIPCCPAARLLQVE